MLKYIKKLNLANITTNIAAGVVFAQTIYPGLNAEMIMTAVGNGTWTTSASNLALMYFLHKAGKK